MSDDFLFADDDGEELEQFEDAGSWKILIVDDEPEVHAVTKLALGDFEFQGKKLEFVSVHSGAEAKQAFHDHDDIAVVLLDVVMETDDAGLLVAKYIREEADNHFTRIILRTGQPGQAPEKEVIVNYDINDYKSKTELTAQKLFTVIIATLRSYRDIVAIEENRKGLEKIIEASANLFSIHSLEHFISGVIQQLASLIGGSKDAAYITSAIAGPRPIDNNKSGQYFVFQGRGEYENSEGKVLEDVIDGEHLMSCQDALKQRKIVYAEDHVAAYCRSKTMHGSLVYLSGLPRQLTKVDQHLIEIFTQNVQIAFDNVLLNKDIEDTQREIVERLSQAMEEHLNSGKHIQRMAVICEVLATKAGMTQTEIERLKLAVPLHDVGKLAVPQKILHKPGSLTDEEFKIARSHAELGYELLKNSRRPIIKTAALLARDHHEHWDGNGYPRGLKGEEIDLSCRIAAIADVFDALRSKRCYKESWPLEKVLETIKEQSGSHFDPKLVTILLNNIDEIEKKLALYPYDE